MSGKVSLEKVNKELQLECSVCLQRYRFPKLLPCFHSFCLSCLTAIADTLTQRSFPCPVCRADIVVPEAGVSAFQANVYLAAQVECAEWGKLAPLCSVCIQRSHHSFASIVPATQKCMDCDKLLCADCLHVHDALLPSHTLVSVSSIGPIQVSKVACCCKHPTEKLRFQCQTCDMPVCRDCCMTLHAGHQCRDIADMSKEARDIVVKVTELVSQLLPVLESKTDLCAKGVQEKQAAKTQLEQNIKQRRDELISTVHQITQKTLKSLDELIKKFEDEYAQNRNSIAQLKSQCDYNRLIIEGGCEADILQAVQNLRATFQHSSLCLGTGKASEQVIHWDKCDEMYFSDQKLETGCLSLQDWALFISIYIGHVNLRKKKKSRVDSQESFAPVISLYMKYRQLLNQFMKPELSTNLFLTMSIDIRKNPQHICTCINLHMYIKTQISSKLRRSFPVC